ncbi:MAG TPA: DUF2203 domain-containing protein [Gemmatimonadaceae bacterium]|jgi:hypothetical protein
MRKNFTVDDANRMLPLVRRIASDAVRDYLKWQDTVRQFEIASLRASADSPDETADQLQQEAERLAHEIEGYIAEAAELGVIVKGLDTGLIDFPGEIDGRPVLLCWQLGEDSVRYWHEEDAGFAGRRPLSQVQVS